MRTKKGILLQIELAGFFFTVVAGTAMHFGFELSGFSRAFAWLFPVNESPWEHLKLSFYPVVFWGLIVYAIVQRSARLRPSAPGGVRNFWFARLLGAYVAVMTTVVSWSLQYLLMGRSILAVDIGMLYAGLLASALLCWRFLCGAPRGNPRRTGRYGLAGLAVLLISFALFSYAVPRSRLWLDRPRQFYGIIEAHLLFDRHLGAQCYPAPALPGFAGFVPLVIVGLLLGACFVSGRRKTTA